MINELLTKTRSRDDGEVVDRFLDSLSEQSFEELFHTFTPQLVAFFLSRRCDFSLAEDLAQEAMLTVYRKARQLRDRRSFRGWLFKIALNAMRAHYDRNRVHEVETANLTTFTDRVAIEQNQQRAGTPAFEFSCWMKLLDSRESEVMKLRFIEQWEYHEIAAAQAIPIGTVQWRIFNAKKKLAPHLGAGQEGIRNGLHKRIPVETASDQFDQIHHPGDRTLAISRLNGEFRDLQEAQTSRLRHRQGDESSRRNRVSGPSAPSRMRYRNPIDAGDEERRTHTGVLVDAA